jgi:hypothetical protein
MSEYRGERSLPGKTMKSCGFAESLFEFVSHNLILLNASQKKEHRD